MENFYHLSKKELSFISSIQEPLLSGSKRRLSRPVFLVYDGNQVVYVWSLSWFRYKVKYNPEFLKSYSVHIRSMY